MSWAQKEDYGMLLAYDQTETLSNALN